MVVLAHGPAVGSCGAAAAVKAASGSTTRPSLPRQPAIQAPSSPRTLPRAFSATMATHASAPMRSPHRPNPAFMARSLPRSLPTLAPQPAPTLPSASGSEASRSNAVRAAARPIAASGCAFSPTSRSKRQAPTTMGTRALSTGNPMPRAASSSMTPVLAASPKALPPERTTACTASIMFSGLSRSVSRVAGPPPRTATPQTAPSGAMATVHPVAVRRSWACPQRKAGRSASVAGWSMARPFSEGIPASIVHLCPFRAVRDRGGVRAKTRAVGRGRGEAGPRATLPPRRGGAAVDRTLRCSPLVPGKTNRCRLAALRRGWYSEAPFRVVVHLSSR